MTEPQLEEAAAITIGALKFAALFNPELAAAMPLITGAIQGGIAHMKAGIAAGEILPDGQGGFVSKTWANDPRHALNPDGSFKDKSW
jgi:hypothetical protein